MEVTDNMYMKKLKNFNRVFGAFLLAVSLIVLGCDVLLPDDDKGSDNQSTNNPNNNPNNGQNNPQNPNNGIKLYTDAEIENIVQNIIQNCVANHGQRHIDEAGAPYDKWHVTDVGLKHTYCILDCAWEQIPQLSGEGTTPETFRKQLKTIYIGGNYLHDAQDRVIGVENVRVKSRDSREHYEILQGGYDDAPQAGTGSVATRTKLYAFPQGTKFYRDTNNVIQIGVQDIDGNEIARF
jgi:ribosomal protein S26